MLNIKRYKLIDDWKLSTGGRTVFAEKEGKKYFLKEYGSIVCPSHQKVVDGIITEERYQKNRALFEKFLNSRVTINERLNTIAGTGGNIICPIEWGVVDSKFVESTEFVDGLMEKEAIIRLSYKDKIMILLTVAGALKSVHKLGIIHGDLKYSNIAVTKNTMGNFVGKLIDFDCSYLQSDKPSDIGGDQIYMAPEVGECFVTEMDPKAISKLDEKADIFSLGIVFHEYLTGHIPKIKNIPKELEWKSPDNIYPWESLLYGGDIEIYPEIKKKNAHMYNLICNMLQTDPSKRPTASGTLKELQCIRGEFEGKVYIEPVPPKPPIPDKFTDPYPEHKIAFVKSKISEMKFVSSKKGEMAGKKVYEFYRENGDKFIYTLEKALASGIAINKSGTDTSKVLHSFTEPYPEHGIIFVDDVIRSMKFVGSKKNVVAGKKVYEFYRDNGSKFIYTLEKAIQSGIAKTK